MTYANIELKEHDRFDYGLKRSVIDPFLKDLIEQLALKYPQWTFVETAVTNIGSSREYYAHRFEVKDKREVLGTIEKEHYNGDYRFAIDNHRIESMRERGSGMKTIHLKKALKHVDKFFGRKSVTEKIAEATQVVGQVVAQVANEKDWALRHTWNGLEKHAKTFVTNNYQQFVDNIVDKSSIQTQINNFPTQLEELQSVDYMKNMLAKGNAFVVFIDGIHYSVQKGKDPLQIKESEELPDFMRRAIGLLKLVEDKQVIGGVGLRVSESTFLVLPNNVS